MSLPQLVCEIGAGLISTGTFTVAATGALANPTAVLFEVKDPLGNITQPVVTQDSTGVYHANFVLTMAGTWWTRWEGDGAVQAAAEEKVICRASQFG